MLNPMSLFARLAFVVVLALSVAGDAFAFGHRVVANNASRACACETAIQGETASVRLQHPFWVQNQGLALIETIAFCTNISATCARRQTAWSTSR
jgi:hypothetical protein